MNKLLLLLSSITVGATAPTMLLSNITNHHNTKVQYEVIESDKVFEEYYSSFQAYMNGTNLTFAGVYAYLEKVPEMIKRVYNENLLSRFESFVDNAVAKAGTLSSLVYNEDRIIVIKNKISRANLDWRKYTNESEFKQRIMEKNISTTDKMQNMYYATNMYYGEEISSEIAKYKAPKEELAGLLGGLPQQEQLVANDQALISSLNTEKDIANKIVNIFDVSLQTINEKMDFIHGIFNFEKTAWIENAKHIIENLPDTIFGLLDKMGVPLTDELREAVDAQIGEIQFDDVEDLEVFMGDVFTDAGEAIVGNIEDLIKEFAEKAVGLVDPVTAPIEIAGIICKALDCALYTETAVMDKVHNDSEFVRNYVLNDLPDMFSIIDDEYDKHPDIIAAEWYNNFLNAQQTLNKFVSQQMNVFSTLNNWDALNDIITFADDVNSEALNWVSDLFVELGGLDSAINAIKDLRQQFVDVSSGVDEEIAAANEKLGTDQSKLVDMKNRVDELNEIISHSQYEKYLSQLNELNDALKPYNEVLNIDELKNAKYEIIIDTKKYFVASYESLTNEELWRENFVHRLLNDYGNNLTNAEIDDLLNENNQYVASFAVFQNYYEEVIDNENIA
jgi:hypothetical protein